MQTEQKQLYTPIWLERSILYLLIFTCGFMNLALEIIGPRLLSPTFGNTTMIWAVIISITLIGISAGYLLGGRITREQISLFLPVILFINTLWLISIDWLARVIPAWFSASPGFFAFVFTVVIIFLTPSMLFGMIPPIAIALLTQSTAFERVPRMIGNTYALSTAGSIFGALCAALYLIPWIGLSLSLNLFGICLAIFGFYYSNTILNTGESSDK